MVKNLPAKAGDIGDAGSIPGSEKSPGEGHGNSLQYSCLENPMDRGVWWATVHGVTQNQTRLKQLSLHNNHIYETDTHLLQSQPNSIKTITSFVSVDIDTKANYSF